MKNSKDDRRARGYRFKEGGLKSFIGRVYTRYDWKCLEKTAEIAVRTLNKFKTGMDRSRKPAQIDRSSLEEVYKTLCDCSPKFAEEFRTLEDFITDFWDLSSIAKNSKRPTGSNRGPIAHRNLELWDPLDHSNPIIGTEEVEDYLGSAVIRVVGELYDLIPERKVPVSKIQRKGGGSENYRVECKDRAPILFRRHGKITVQKPEMLKTLHAVHRHIYESGVFSDTSYGDCLRPILTKTGDEFVQAEFPDSVSGAPTARFLTVFPFADDVEHYSGQRIEQVLSFARKFGAAQKAVQGLDSAIDLRLLLPRHGYLQEGTNKDLYEKLRNAVEATVTRMDSPPRIDRVFHDRRAFLDEVFEVIGDRFEIDRSKALPQFHDLHPHNTFFKGDECVLIYDYEAVVRRWSEEESLAFTAHRFIREYIRHTGDGLKAKSERRAIVERFMEQYSAGGGSVPPNFLKTMHEAIWYTGFLKLMRPLQKFHNMGDDPRLEGDERHTAEFEKFLLFLREAAEFKF